MALKNKSMYAILGILSLSPKTGYDIKKYSDNILASFWNENFGHIYPTLKKLTEDGLIEIVNASENDRRIVYGITESGKEEFGAWLAEETVPQPIRSEFMLKLLFSDSLPAEDVVKALERHKARQQARLDEYYGMQDKLADELRDVPKNRAVFLRAVLRSGILAAEASVRWCDETIEYVKTNME